MGDIKVKKKTLFIALISILLCGCYNYTGWHKEVIPTNTEYKGTIKIPDEWHFESNEGIVSIKDQEENEVAIEIFQGTRHYGYIGDEKVDNWDELEINHLEGYELEREENYTLIRGTSSASYIYQYSDDAHENYCLRMMIYDTPNNINYSLAIIFLIEIEYEDVDKMAESYRWGGRIKE